MMDNDLGEPAMPNRTAVYAEVERSVTEARPIGDRTAQTIAAWWAEAIGPIRVLADHGTIALGVMVELVHAHSEADTRADRDAVAALIAYCGWHGGRGPVDGWATR